MFPYMFPHQNPWSTTAQGNICFLGALHHGKTTFMDLLVLNTHEKDWKVGKEIRSLARQWEEIHRSPWEEYLQIKSLSLLFGWIDLQIDLHIYYGIFGSSRCFWLDLKYD